MATPSNTAAAGPRRLSAEVWRRREEGEWEQVASGYGAVTINCSQKSPIWVFHVSVTHPLSGDTLLDSRIFHPGTNVERGTSAKSVHWTDKGSTWGLSFASERDTFRFLSCCTPPTLQPHLQGYPVRDVDPSQRPLARRSTHRPESSGRHINDMDDLVLENPTALGDTRPNIVPVQKPISRPMDARLRPGAPNQNRATRHHVVSASVQSTARISDESQYSSISVVPGAHLQGKRPVKSGARVNIMQLDQYIPPSATPTDQQKRSSRQNKEATSKSTGRDKPSNILPKQYSSHSRQSSSTYQNTTDPVYSEILTVKQKTVRNEYDVPPTPSETYDLPADAHSGESEVVTQAAVETPSIEIKQPTSAATEWKQDFEGIQGFQDLDELEVLSGSGGSPDSWDREFHRSIFFNECDELTPLDEQPVGEEPPSLTDALTLEDLSCNNRCSVVSQSDSGFGGNCVGSDVMIKSALSDQSDIASSTTEGLGEISIHDLPPLRLKGEYVNVDAPRQYNSGGSGGSANPSADSGIGPGENEDEKLRSFIEENERVTDEAGSEISDDVSLSSSSGQQTQPGSDKKDQSSGGGGGAGVGQSGVTKQYTGITRKAGWLEIKHILILRKKKLEAAPKRKWYKYWCCLKGVALLFYSTSNGEQPAIDENTQPAHAMSIENCIGQSIPEHPKKENIFSLSTATGDVYLFEAPSQIEVENWITSIHSSCSSAFVLSVGSGGGGGGKKTSDTISVLREEIRKREEQMDTDCKMRKMAELQLSVTSDPKNRQPILAQIDKWDHSLERMQCDLYRLRCYCASIQGSELPNPKTLLAAVSKETKSQLAKVNCFNVSSIHALLSARHSADSLEPVTSSSLERRRKNVLSVLKSKDEPSSNISKQSKRKSWRARDDDKDPMASLAEEWNPNPATSLDPTVRSAPVGAEDQSGFPWGEQNQLIGRLVRVSLPHNQKTVVPVKPGMTVYELLLNCCKKRKLDPRDHFIRIRAANAQQSDKWIIPAYKARLENLECKEIQLCIKEYHSMTLARNPGERFGIEYETVQESSTVHGDSRSPVRDEPRLFVVDVIPGSVAMRGGLTPGDEIIEVNSQSVSTVDPVNIDYLLNNDLLQLVVRSMRPSSAPCTKCSQAHDTAAEMKKCMQSASRARPIRAGPQRGERPVSEIGPDKRRSMISDLSDQNSSGGGSDGASATSSDTYKLACVLQELVNSEEKYINDLQLLLERFLEPMAKTNFLNAPELIALAKNTRDILMFQRQFFQQLKQVTTAEDPFCFTELHQFHAVLVAVSDIFRSHVDKFKLYSSFCANHSKAQKTFENARDMHEFKLFLEHTNPENEHSKSLESFLIKPIQRVLKYKLLLKEIKTLSPDTTTAAASLQLAHESMESVAELINDMKRIHEEYGPIFDDLLSETRIDQNCDIPMDELQMYGSALWLNCPDEVVSKKIRGQNQEIEVILFIFKRAIVLVGYVREKNQRTKKKSLPSKESKLEEAISNLQFLIPISAVDVHAGHNSDRLFQWDLLVHRGAHTQCLKMGSRAISTKDSFLRAIRSSMRENERAQTRRKMQKNDQRIRRSSSQTCYSSGGNLQPYNITISEQHQQIDPRANVRMRQHQAVASISPDRLSNCRIAQSPSEFRARPLGVVLPKHDSYGSPSPGSADSGSFSRSPIGFNMMSQSMQLQMMLNSMSPQALGQMPAAPNPSHQRTPSNSNSAHMMSSHVRKTTAVDSGIFSDENTEHSVNSKLATALEQLNCQYPATAPGQSRSLPRESTDVNH